MRPCEYGKRKQHFLKKLSLPTDQKKASRSINILVQMPSKSVSDPQQQLFEACRKGRIEAVRTLISEGGAEANGRCLLDAALNGHTDLVRMLVETHGVAVGTTRVTGATALHLAASGGHTELARLLVKELGLSVDAKDKSHETAFHYAVRGGHAECVRVLAAELGATISDDEREGGELLCEAAANGEVETVRVLVEDLGFNVNAEGSDDGTALHCAVSAGLADMVGVLVGELGADVNVECNGITPLQFASIGGEVEIIQLLTAAGAEVDASSKTSAPAIAQAAKWGRAGAVEALAAAGATVDAAALKASRNSNVMGALAKEV